MTAAETNEIVSVLKSVQEWSVPMRKALAKRILDTIEELPRSNVSQKSPPGLSAVEVAALFRTDKPTPDDAAVKQWIDEHRTEKYGT